MIELELLGANGDSIVLADDHGERYTLLVDDAVRTAVRRARAVRPAAPAASPADGSPARPKDLQALMRAGASAEEVATATGLDVDHVRRFEGPVLAERAWAVEQAQACRIGWEKDSPVLGELVVDRLATRAVAPETLEWDALREGREPWQVTLTFAQGGEEKHASWELDLQAHSVSALDDEARWLTEAAGSRRPDVFDQDSEARGASSGRHLRRRAVAEPAAPQQPETIEAPAAPTPAPTAEAADPTDALLADLSASRGQRVEVEAPEETGAIDVTGAASAADAPSAGSSAAPETSPSGQAQIVSMSERRRAHLGNHPAGSKLPQIEAPAPAAPQAPAPQAEDTAADSTAPEHGEQDALPDMPEAPKPKAAKRRRRSVPSWDEIVFGAKPE